MHKFFMSLALTGGMALAGCGGSDTVADKAAEKMIEHQASQDGQEVDVDLDSSAGTYSVTSKEGNTQVNFGGQGGSVPEGWPEDVPVMEGLNITVSHSSSSDGQNTITGSISKPVEEAAGYYKKAFTDNGWTEDDVSTMNMQGMNMTNLRYTKDSRTVTANIVQQGDTTQLTLVVEMN